MSNPGRAITLYEFSRLFSKAWHKGLTPENIISGFRVTGVYPFDRSVINAAVGKKTEACSSFEPASLAERTGLHYIPLYSPARQPNTTLAKTSDLSLAHQSLLNFSTTSLEDSLFQCEDDVRHNLPLQTTMSLSKFFIKPIPPNKIPTKHGKSCGKVMTST